jgi:hypothetical protein
MTHSEQTIDPAERAYLPGGQFNPMAGREKQKMETDKTHSEH